MKTAVSVTLQPNLKDQKPTEIITLHSNTLEALPLKTV
jgi:hypothetical protein